jgi:hypothetical protein
MFNPAKWQLHRGFSRARLLKPPGAETRFGCTRGPESFCSSSGLRRAKMSRSPQQMKTFNTQLEIPA